MKLNRRSFVAYVSATFLLFTGCRSTSPTVVDSEPLAPGPAYMAGDALETDLRLFVRTLASDEMRGREAGTDGERAAAEYIAQTLQRSGILPAVDGAGEADYFQEFDVRTTAFDLANTHLQLHGGEEGRIGRDWIAFPDHAPVVMMDSANVVFAGYGISAPEQGHDDYALISAGGKVVVALAGAPQGVDSVRTFGGNYAASDFLVKWIAAAQRGAAALVVIGEEQTLSLWEDYGTLARGTAMTLDDAEEYVPVMPYLFVSRDYGEYLLDVLRQDGDEDIDPAGQVAPPFHTDRYVSLHLLTEKSVTITQNVVGYLPGRLDSNTFVALGAHYDHLGVDAEGNVFNGADDNASGVAAVLATARAIARDAQANRSTDRSILFVFHGAEEKGLLGAQYFTENPAQTVARDMNRLVAHFNLDMVGREHRDSLHVVGAYRMSSALGKLVDSVNVALGEGTPVFHFERSYDDPDDPENIYERSDHYRYALKGVPSVFFTDGMGANWRKDTSEDHYHAVDDDVERIDFEKLARVSRLVYEVTRAVSSSNARFEIDGEIPVEL